MRSLFCYVISPFPWGGAHGRSNPHHNGCAKLPSLFFSYQYQHCFKKMVDLGSITPLQFLDAAQLHHLQGKLKLNSLGRQRKPDLYGLTRSGREYFNLQRAGGRADCLTGA